MRSRCAPSDSCGFSPHCNWTLKHRIPCAAKDDASAGVDKIDVSVDGCLGTSFPQIEAGRYRLLVGGRTDDQPPTVRRILMGTMAATELLARSTTLTSVGWIGYIVIGAI